MFLISVLQVVFPPYWPLIYFHVNDLRRCSFLRELFEKVALCMSGMLGVGPGNVKYPTKLEEAEEGVDEIHWHPAGTGRNTSRYP